MKRFILPLLLLAGLCTVADAGNFEYRHNCQQRCVNGRCSSSCHTFQSYRGGGVHQIAQHKSQVMASRRSYGHPGGCTPHGLREGTGYGPTPHAAQRNCCYYGRRPLVCCGVSRGCDGNYYACCFFR